MEGRYMPVDLIALDMLGFDVILGVDWLVKYHVVIDCHKQVVKFSMLDSDASVYKSDA